jgi:hypothetical protein
MQEQKTVKIDVRDAGACIRLGTETLSCSEPVPDENQQCYWW